MGHRRFVRLTKPAKPQPRRPTREERLQLLQEDIGLLAEAFGAFTEPSPPLRVIVPPLELLPKPAHGGKLDPYAKIAFAEVAELDLKHIRQYVPESDFPLLAQELQYCIEIARTSAGAAREALARELENELRRLKGKRPKRFSRRSIWSRYLST